MALPKPKEATAYEIKENESSLQRTGKAGSICLGRESYYTATPKISMEGKWLEALGFHIGDAIEVSYEDNCIRITPAPQPVMVCEPQAPYGEAPGKRKAKK